MAAKVVHAHIGSSKTGTTFIQQALWANKAAWTQTRSCCQDVVGVSKVTRHVR